MAITQNTLTVSPTTPGEKRASATWNSGLSNPKLVGALAVLPTETNALAAPAVTVRAKVVAAVVTVEVSSISPLTGPVDVLVSVDA